MLAGGAAGGMANSFASAGARVGAKPVSMGDSFANANARVGGQKLPGGKAGSRLAVTSVSAAGDSFATAGARVAGIAMPKRVCEQSIKEGSEGCADADIETQQGRSATRGISGPAAGCVVKVPNPYAGLLSIDLGADPASVAVAVNKDSTNNALTTLSAPLMATTSSSPKADDNQPPPNPFASSSKRSEPLLDGWRQLAG